jgi:hypothetical protein
MSPKLDAMVGTTIFMKLKVLQRKMVKKMKLFSTADLTLKYLLFLFFFIDWRAGT